MEWPWLWLCTVPAAWCRRNHNQRTHLNTEGISRSAVFKTMSLSRFLSRRSTVNSADPTSLPGQCNPKRLAWVFNALPSSSSLKLCLALSFNQLPILQCSFQLDSIYYSAPCLKMDDICPLARAQWSDMPTPAAPQLQECLVGGVSSPS